MSNVKIIGNHKEEISQKSVAVFELLQYVLPNHRRSKFRQCLPIFSEVLKRRLSATGVPVAASMLQGAPPCFLEKWVYDLMVMGDNEKLELGVSVNDITADKRLCGKGKSTKK